EFEAAEEDRLRYVAATRARETLIVNVTLKKDGAPAGPWAFLARGLPNAPVPVESAVLQPERVPRDLGPAFRDAQAARAARWSAAAIPTSALATVTARAHALGPRAPSAAEDARGPAWGRVLHGLLEVAMRDEAPDLKILAGNLLRVEELPAELLADVLRVAESVTSSEVWTRAKHASRRFVEVPFEILVPREELGISDGPADVLLKGAMDLVFEEKGQWLIVDWKSDAVGTDLEGLIAHYAPQVRIYRAYWERLTRQPARAGLYFMDNGHLHWLENREGISPKGDERSFGAHRGPAAPRQGSLFDE
ncbi:MAG TPA: PD-(D/E)XK nuclease family protein, partial [Thermoanaerobaculia bacterium]|nr:PD-(D/E)XK nuclease family protein [Thermoanaerobaculia bacterium]